MESPVVLFFFNRPAGTSEVMAAIRQARPERVFLVQDGPRAGVATDTEDVLAARVVAESIDWPCQVHRIYAPTNLGLHARLKSGLDEVFSLVDRAIIFEDDCVADPSFFRFAEELLERYADDHRIGVVSGNNFLRGRQVSSDSYFFSPDVRIWGWATWARVWQDFSREGFDAPWTAEEMERVTLRLDSRTRRRAVRQMAMRGVTRESWDVRFVLHCLGRGYLNATPSKNLVTNIGFGMGATHTHFESFTASVPQEELAFPLRHPERVVPDPKAGRLEATMHRRMWLSFPLRHPIDFAGRVLRYLAR